MREKLFWIIVIVLMVFASVLPKEKPMAIDFEASTGDQYIDFGEVNALKSLGTRTICAWIKAESANPYAHILDINGYPITGPLDNTGYMLWLGDSGNKTSFIAGWTTSFGQWDSTSATITTGNNELICVSYNSSSTTNDPIIYLNGSSVAITEVSTPSGTLIDAYTATPKTKIGFGGIISGSLTRFDGVIRKVSVYNRILTAAEILEMYNSRGLDYPRSGLVFCPVLHGAKGLQAFDGATLAAGNLIVDPCSGATGTPNGSPVGVGETYLSIK